MEATALCRLLFHVLVFLCAEDQRCDGNAASLRVDPNRLQFFEYDSVRMDCEGFGVEAEWRVMKRTVGEEETCGSSCFIKHVLPADSGEYWCQAEGGRSRSVSISVTDGPVVLLSPALPVTEGDSVTLSCRNKAPSSRPVADFYKDGRLVQTGYEGNVTIHNVSASDEGRYRCLIAGAGESAESRLDVRASSLKEPHSSHRRSPHVFLLCVTVVLFLVNVPLLLVGLRLCRTYRVFDCDSSETSASPSGETGAVHPVRAECPAVTQTVSYTEAECLAADSDPSYMDEYTYYYTIE